MTIKSERVRLGLSREQAAAELDVHPNSLAAWEQGLAIPSGKNLVKLTHLFGCTPEYLLGMTDERK